MSEIVKRGPGRPPKPPSHARRHTVTTQLSPEPFTQLQKAAERNLHSIGREVADRLLRTLAEDRRTGDHEAAMLLQAINAVIWSVERQTGKKWHSDYLTGVALKTALLRALDALMPQPSSPELEQLTSQDILDRADLSPEMEASVRAYDVTLSHAFELGVSVGQQTAAELSDKLGPKS